MIHTIKAVIFDFGGVFTASPFTAIETMTQELDVATELFADLVFGPYHDDTNHPWHQLERGEISLEQARNDIKQAAAEQNLDIDLYDLLMKMGGGDHFVHQALIDWTASLEQRQLRRAMITNNVIEFRDGWRALLDVDGLFEHVTDSSEVGLRKPNPAIYQYSLDTLNLQPHEAIFVDDLDSNVNAARNIGMHGVVADPDPLKTIQALEMALSNHS